MTKFSDSLKVFAKKIHDEVYKTYFDYKTTIFLCGAGNDSTNSVRKQIDDSFQDWNLNYRYDIVYPEDLFDELLFGQRHHDLLTLENILADGVDAIVLVIESYGAVAELGVFATNDKLRKKLVCIADSKFKKSKSFINYGPFRLLKDTRQGVVMYGDYNDVENMMEPIRKAIYKVRRSTSKSIRVNNVLQAHHYILSCIFLLEPVLKDMLMKMVLYASESDQITANAITTAALSMLRKKKEVYLTSKGYKLTSAGLERFKALSSRGRMKSTYDLRALDRLRVAVLNWKYRDKLLNI